MAAESFTGKPRLQPEAHASFQLVALANRISASASRAYLRNFGVGVMEWRVLALLALKVRTTAQEISQLSGLDKSSVSRAVQALIRRADVAAAADPADNRRAVLTLTAQGEALHDRIILSSLARERLLLAGLSADEQRTLFDLLRRLSANMDLVEAHDPADDKAGAGSIEKRP